MHHWRFFSIAADLPSQTGVFEARSLCDRQCIDICSEQDRFPGSILQDRNQPVASDPCPNLKIGAQAPEMLNN
jgi:hypothetical protein